MEGPEGRRHIPRRLYPVSKYLNDYPVLVARRLRHQMMCARDPVDRALAKSLGVPFERVEQDRRLFGEIQSYYREVMNDCGICHSSDEARERREEIKLGIEVLHHLLFGIETERSRLATCGDARTKLCIILDQWDHGEYGDPEEQESAARFIIAVGKALREHEDERRARCKRREGTLRDTQSALDQSDLESDRRDFLEALEIGLRFNLFCQYGRPFGDDHLIADEFIDAAKQLHDERVSGALGQEPRATFRWIVEIGRALREHTFDPIKDRPAT